MHTSPRALALITALGFAVPAIAATPESGTVSGDSPSIKWKGQAPGYGIVEANSAGQAAGQAPVCEAPACDTFALEVADSADLVVSALDDVGRGFVEIDVIRPDGTLVYVWSGAGSAAMVRVKNAPKGAYKIQIQTNLAPHEGGDYTATASLSVAKPPVSSPGPAQTPVGGTAPPNQSAPSPTVTLRTPKLAARKARRSAALGISASGPVTQLRVILKKGKKVLASRGLAKLDGNATVKLKLRKPLKPGTYTVALSAKDSGGSTVGSTSRLVVKR